KSQTLCRSAVLGPTGAELWRSASAPARRGTRARGTGRESNRANLHRRPKRRLALSSFAQSRLRQSTGVGFSRRRVATERLLRDRGRSMRAAREQAVARGDRELPALSDSRVGIVEASSRHCSSWTVGV